MNLNSLIILILLSVFIFPALSYADDETEQAEHEIRLALETWTTDFNDKEADKVCRLFAPDLIANYGDYPELTYESICDQLKSSLTMEDKTFHYSLDIQEIIVSGDLAIVRLIWTLDVNDKSDNLIETTKDRGIDIFKRQADGNWKISRYIAYQMDKK